MTVMCTFVLNRFRETPLRWSEAENALYNDPDISRLHRALPEYRPTPLVALPGLAQLLKIGQLHVKDESHRFGLKAFKALGASYAMYKWIVVRCIERGIPVPAPEEVYAEGTHLAVGDVTFCTATDGNHGRGVAWVAQKLGRPSQIYMPAGSAGARIEAIRSHGATVIVIDGDYDAAVQQCSEDASKNGWQIISDTSWPGYTDIPAWINAGYTTIFREIDEQPGDKRPDLVIVPGGVGALAAAASWYYNRQGAGRQPKLLCVEPAAADCLAASARTPDGQPVAIAGKGSTIMAGLNCRTPSLIAWPMIKRGFDGFFVISDDWCRRAMQAYYFPTSADPQITSGESGAAPLAALLALCESSSMSVARETLSLTPQSAVLLLNTEGDTDPINFRQIIAARP